jgi:hypothetical protein
VNSIAGEALRILRGPRRRFPSLLGIAVAASALLFCSVGHADSENSALSLSGGDATQTSVNLSTNECDISSGTCFSASVLSSTPYYFSPNGTTPSPYVGAASTPGNAAGAIDVWGYCRYVNDITDGPGQESGWVPFRSQTEWTAFIKNAPPSLFNLITCARPETVQLTPDSRCGSPVPVSETVNLPYDPTGTVLQGVAYFQCTTADGQTWTETAFATETALNSDISSPSWDTSVTYGGNPPPPESVCSVPDGLSPLNLTAPPPPTTTPVFIDSNGTYAEPGSAVIVVGSYLTSVTITGSTYVEINGSLNNVEVDAAGAAVIVSGNNNTISANGSSIWLFSNGSNQTVNVNGNGATICSTGNNGTVAADGADDIVASAGQNDSNITTGQNTTVVSAGQNDTNSANGQGATITSTGQNDTNTANSQNSTINLTGNNDSDAATGSGATVKSQ